jgi:hypothetical protein
MFSKIKIDKYQRTCSEDCYGNGLRSIQKLAYNDHNNCKEKFSFQAFFNNALFNNNHHDDDETCKGESIGLISNFLHTIYSLSNKIHFWRIYFKQFILEKTLETGSLNLLVESVDKSFSEYDTNVIEKLQSNMEQSIKRYYPGGHLQIQNITGRRISGGKIFVSLPLDHPMTEEWLNCIRTIGKKTGFTEIDTVRTFTEPVTPHVGDQLKASHGMIQILARPPREFSRIQEFQLGMTAGLEWLYAEYLTAVTNDLKIIRLIETTSIDEYAVPIGRDHVNMKFSVSEPFSSFKAKIEQAFQYLRSDLAEKLGLS